MIQATPSKQPVGTGCVDARSEAPSGCHHGGASGIRGTGEGASGIKSVGNSTSENRELLISKFMSR
jgi:hypothetical protein